MDKILLWNYVEMEERIIIRVASVICDYMIDCIHCDPLILSKNWTVSHKFPSVHFIISAKLMIFWVVSRYFRLIPPSEDCFEYLLGLPYDSSYQIFHYTILSDKALSRTKTLFKLLWNTVQYLLPFYLWIANKCEYSIRVMLFRHVQNSFFLFRRISWKIILLDSISRWHDT